MFLDHALGQAGRVAEVDEQDAAMVAHAVDPAGQLYRLADIGFAELAASMGSVDMHGLIYNREAAQPQRVLSGHPKVCRLIFPASGRAGEKAGFALLTVRL